MHWLAGGDARVVCACACACLVVRKGCLRERCVRLRACRSAAAAADADADVNSRYCVGLAACVGAEEARASLVAASELRLGLCSTCKSCAGRDTRRNALNAKFAVCFQFRLGQCGSSTCQFQLSATNVVRHNTILLTPNTITSSL